MEKAGDYGAMSATSRVGKSFGARLPETSSKASIIEACMIGERVATDNDVQMEVATHDINERWCRDLTHTGSRDSSGRPKSRRET